MDAFKNFWLLSLQIFFFLYCSYFGIINKYLGIKKYFLFIIIRKVLNTQYNDKNMTSYS
jgi:hypothetical protein